MNLFADMGDCPRVFAFQDRRSGLQALICVDDLTLGPAAGGIRTDVYETEAAALQDARELARAMTQKCALAGLRAGGSKTVVLRQQGMDRPAAFRALGAFIEELGGMVRCAGDLGTTDEDLASVALATQYVHLNTAELAQAVAHGAMLCMEAAAEERGRDFETLSVGIQGCGAIGHALATELAERGVRLSVADLDPKHATRTAGLTGASIMDPAEVLVAELDIIAPCATGGVVTPQVAREMRAFCLCGAANNILAGPSVAEILLERSILHVPDVLASAGAVIDGIGETVMGLTDRGPLIRELKVTARRLFERAGAEGLTTSALAARVADERVQAAR